MQDNDTQCIDYDTDINYSMTIFINIQLCSIKLKKRILNILLSSNV